MYSAGPRKYELVLYPASFSFQVNVVEVEHKLVGGLNSVELVVANEIVRR